jgi:hypothetical protein
MTKLKSEACGAGVEPAFGNCEKRFSDAAPAAGRCKACVLLALNLFPLLKFGQRVVVDLQEE